MDYKSLENFRDKLCKELEKIADKADLSSTILETSDKLTRTIKNIDKILAGKDEYSQRGYYRDYDDRYDDGPYSGARMRMRRDSRGRYDGRAYRDGYSGHSRDELTDQLRDMMADAPDEETRKSIERLVRQMEKA